MLKLTHHGSIKAWVRNSIYSKESHLMENVIITLRNLYTDVYHYDYDDVYADYDIHHFANCSD